MQQIGYEFNLTYEGDLIVNEAKDGEVTLTGINGTPYEKVRVESVSVSGPASPTIYAYDEEGNKFDLTSGGGWGPQSGFPIGGTFTNKTKITAIYPKAGTYVSKLSLVDLSNNNAVITSKEFTITVKEVPDNNVISNIQNNAIDEIPQAGTNIWTYLSIITIVVLAITLGRKYLIKK